MANGYQGYQGAVGYGDPARAQLDRKRQIAELLQQGATDTSPKSFWEGAAQLGKAFIARGANERADAAESAYATDKARRLAQYFNPKADEQGRNLAPDVNVRADVEPALPTTDAHIKALANTFAGSVAPQGAAPSPPLGGQMAPAPASTPTPNVKAIAATLAPVETAPQPMQTGSPLHPQMAVDGYSGEPVSMPMTAAQMPKPAPDRNALMQQALRYTGGDFQQAAAMVEAKLGPAPRRQFLQGPNGQISLGNLDDGTVQQLQAGTPKPADPVKMETIQAKDGRYYSYNPYTNETKPLDVFGHVPGEGGADGVANYRPATPEDLKKWNIPEGVSVKINTRTNEPEVISGARTPSVYTPIEQKNYRAKANGISTLKNLSDQYRSLVNQYGPGLFDGHIKDGHWEKTPEGQKLLAAHNNLMMFVKGPEMFNLGVLTGPDVERLQRTLPEPVGPSAFGQTRETIGIGLDSIDQLLGYQLNQIPDEYRTAAGQAEQPGQSSPSPAVQYTPDEVMQAKLALQNWDRLPASVKTPQNRARAEQVAGVSKPSGQPQQPTRYQPGDIEIDDETGQKFRLKGGDDKDPANWEPVR